MHLVGNSRSLREVCYIFNCTEVIAGNGIIIIQEIGGGGNPDN